MRILMGALGASGRARTLAGLPSTSHKPVLVYPAHITAVTIKLATELYFVSGRQSHLSGLVTNRPGDGSIALQIGGMYPTQG
jgi:hypothetical protein